MFPKEKEQILRTFIRDDWLKNLGASQLVKNPAPKDLSLLVFGVEEIAYNILKRLDISVVLAFRGCCREMNNTLCNIPAHGHSLLTSLLSRHIANWRRPPQIEDVPEEEAK